MGIDQDIKNNPHKSVHCVVLNMHKLKFLSRKKIPEILNCLEKNISKFAFRHAIPHAIPCTIPYAIPPGEGKRFMWVIFLCLDQFPPGSQNVNQNPCWRDLILIQVSDQDINILRRYKELL